MNTTELQAKLAETNEAIARKEAAIVVSIQRNSRIVHKRLRGEVRFLKDLKAQIEAKLAQATL